MSQAVSVILILFESQDFGRDPRQFMIPKRKMKNYVIQSPQGDM